MAVRKEERARTGALSRRLVAISLDKDKSLICNHFTSLKPGLAGCNNAKEILGFEVGGVPPIGFYGVKTILDPDVLERDKLACGGGDTKTEMVIASKDIEEFGFEVEIADVKK